jgi:alkylation response protein AidB-like acyl-CoA dehydrogenase
MDITEPNAGSDVGALHTRAVQAEDGSWSLTGQKIFITSGNGKYHIVLARTEASDDTADPMAGLGGLSLFLVEGWTEDADGNRVRQATMSRIEEKLGHHASPTVAVEFEDAPAKLIGKRGEGFKMMLLLMNNARISVGFEGLGVCEASLRMAKAYAAERVSMGKTIDKHEIIADYIDEMETTVAGLRAICVDAAFNEELAQRKRLRLLYMPPEDPDEKKALEREVKELAWKSRLNTPLLKYLAAEAAVEMSRKALQIHGGYGYTTEYGAEKLLRDSLVLPIYEGTSQIQALMATKDALQFILKDPGVFLRRLTQAQFDARFAAGPRVRRVAQLRLNVMLAQRNLMMRIAGKKASGLRGRPVSEWRAGFVDEWDMRTDFAPALLHSERLTQMMIDLRIADTLAKQALKFPERADLLERHLERAEPRSRFLLDQIRSTGDRLLALLRSEPERQAAK